MRKILLIISFFLAAYASADSVSEEPTQAEIWAQHPLVLQESDEYPEGFHLVVGKEEPPVTTAFPVKRGTTKKILKDWGSQSLKSVPDHSYRSIWVRMFPILSTPPGEPYPVTSDRTKLLLYNSGGLEVRGVENGRFITSGNRIDFDFSAHRMKVGGSSYALEKIWIVPRNTAITTTAKWDKGKSNEVGLELRGQFVVKATKYREDKKWRWSLINVLKIRDYLYAVLPSEMPTSFETEALHVQAVAARTYAMYEMAEARGRVKDFQGVSTKWRGWDVDPTTWFQSYRGNKFKHRGKWVNIERAVANKAVDATLHQIVTYRGEVIKAFFSASSGGRSCTAKECFQWPSHWRNPGYLLVVKDAPGIQDAPLGTWGSKANITPQTIARRLKKQEVAYEGEPSHLEENEIGPSGRVWSMDVVMKDGSRLELDRINSRKMRALFGRIKSYFFELFEPEEDGSQKVVGHGYGHGVGMSQWGAQLFAKQGWKYRNILEHYYSNAKVVDPSITAEELDALSN